MNSNLVNPKNVNIHIHKNPFLSPALIIKNKGIKPYIIYDPLAAHNLDYLRRVLDTTSHGIVPFLHYLTSKYSSEFTIICKKNPFTLDSNNCINSINSVVDIYLLLKILRDFFQKNKDLKDSKLILKNTLLLFKTRNKFSHSEHLQEDKQKKKNPQMVHSLRNSNELKKYIQSSINLLELLINYPISKKQRNKINLTLLSLQSTYNIVLDSIKIKNNREKLENSKIDPIKTAEKTLNMLQKKISTGTLKERENVAKSIINLLTARMS
jgi:hypothetical protein